MKRVEAVIRRERVDAVCKALERIGHTGLMLSEVGGHGRERGAEQRVRGFAYEVDLIFKARIALVVPDEVVSAITEAIQKAAFTGEVGDGKIFIHPVEDAIRIRTAERGTDAIR